MDQDLFDQVIERIRDLRVILAERKDELKCFFEFEDDNETKESK